MTCNEAEYAAVIFGLERLVALPPGRRPGGIQVYSDSRVVVDGLTGRAAIQVPALRRAAARVQRLAARFERVTFQHLPREQNRLADALAGEALAGWPPAAPGPHQPAPHEEVVAAFFSPWRKP
jgi:ribonuclease HI